MCIACLLLLPFLLVDALDRVEADDRLQLREVIVHDSKFVLEHKSSILLIFATLHHFEILVHELLLRRGQEEGSKVFQFEATWISGHRDCFAFYQRCEVVYYFWVARQDGCDGVLRVRTLPADLQLLLTQALLTLLDDCLDFLLGESAPGLWTLDCKQGLRVVSLKHRSLKCCLVLSPVAGSTETLARRVGSRAEGMRVSPLEERRLHRYLRHHQAVLPFPFEQLQLSFSSLGKVVGVGSACLLVGLSLLRLQTGLEIRMLRKTWSRRGFLALELLAHCLWTLQSEPRALHIFVWIHIER